MRRWISAMAALGAATVLALGAGASAATDNLGLKTDGELTVGSDIPYAPFEFYASPGSSTVVGFDVDLVNAAAKVIGIPKVKFVNQSFDTIFVAVAQHRFDMVASSVSITPARAKKVLFSKPYFEATQSVMVKRGSSIRSTKDLKGEVLGAQAGTTGADLAKTLGGSDVKLYNKVDDAFSALAQGRVAAVINDFAISAYATKAKKNLVVVQNIRTQAEPYGLVFPKDKTALRDAFNRAVATIKKNGTYAKIYKKWFKKAPPTT